MNNRKRKIKKKSFVILIIFLLLIIGSFFAIKSFFNNNSIDKNLKIELKGDEEIVLKYNDDYQDLGAVARYKDKDISNNIKVINNVDLSHVGKYSYTYKITYEGHTKEVKRTIKVIDDDKPVIKLMGREDLSIVVGNKYIEYGARANDLYDGDISSKVEIDTSSLDINKTGNYKIKYLIKDSNGNESSTYRNVNVVDKPSTNQKIPVLNYHFFYKNESEKCNQDICLSVDKFREQLDYLKNNGFYTLTIQEFVDWIYGEIDLPSKSVLITVDDGGYGTSKINGNHLIPILEEYKMYATLFLVSGWWGGDNYQSDYLEIQSHTHTLHVEGKGCSYRSKVNCISYDELLKDLKASIESIGSANAFCFPYYEYSNTSLKAVKDAGFKTAFVGGWSKASRSNDKYKIPRYPIQRNISFATFKSIVN